MGVQVEFHTGVADELGFACRLLRKACRQGARVLVRAPTPRLVRLDRELWTFSEREFLPHVRFRAPGPVPATAGRTPIWLVEGEVPADSPPVLVNLGGTMPALLEPFTRIIEIVALDPEEEQEGRARWRAYRSMGFDVMHHAGGSASKDAGHG